MNNNKPKHICPFKDYHKTGVDHKLKVKKFINYQVVCSCGAKSTKATTRRKAVKSWFNILAKCA